MAKVGRTSDLSDRLLGQAKYLRWPIVQFPRVPLSKTIASLPAKANCLVSTHRSYLHDSVPLRNVVSAVHKKPRRIFPADRRQPVAASWVALKRRSHSLELSNACKRKCEVHATGLRPTCRCIMLRRGIIRAIKNDSAATPRIARQGNSDCATPDRGAASPSASSIGHLRYRTKQGVGATIGDTRRTMSKHSILKGVSIWHNNHCKAANARPVRGGENGRQGRSR